jgi:hypothetical protein
MRHAARHEDALLGTRGLMPQAPAPLDEIGQQLLAWQAGVQPGLVVGDAISLLQPTLLT